MITGFSQRMHHKRQHKNKKKSQYSRSMFWSHQELWWWQKSDKCLCWRSIMDQLGTIHNHFSVCWGLPPFHDSQSICFYFIYLSLPPTIKATVRKNWFLRFTEKKLINWKGYSVVKNSNNFDTIVIIFQWLSCNFTRKYYRNKVEVIWAKTFNIIRLTCNFKKDFENEVPVWPQSYFENKML